MNKQLHLLSTINGNCDSPEDEVQAWTIPHGILIEHNFPLIGPLGAQCGIISIPIRLKVNDCLV